MPTWLWKPPFLGKKRVSDICSAPSIVSVYRLNEPFGGHLKSLGWMRPFEPPNWDFTRLIDGSIWNTRVIGFQQQFHGQKNEFKAIKEVHCTEIMDTTQKVVWSVSGNVWKCMEVWSTPRLQGGAKTSSIICSMFTIYWAIQPGRGQKSHAPGRRFWHRDSSECPLVLWGNPQSLMITADFDGYIYKILYMWTFPLPCLTTRG